MSIFFNNKLEVKIKKGRDEYNKPKFKEETFKVSGKVEDHEEIMKDGQGVERVTSLKLFIEPKIKIKTGDYIEGREIVNIKSIRNFKGALTYYEVLCI